MTSKTRLAALSAIALAVTVASHFLHLTRVASTPSSPTSSRPSASEPGGAAPRAAIGVQPVAPEPALADAAGVLEVRVVGGGEPVAGSILRLYRRTGSEESSWSLLSTTTAGADGRARLPAHPGAYVLAARAEGWPVTIQGAYKPSSEDLTHVEVVLERGVDLAGVTLDVVKKNPVTPATITAHQRFAPPAEGLAVAVDARGRFVLSGLAPGDWVLDGEAPGSGKATASIRLPAPPTTLVFRGSGFADGFVRFPDGGAAGGARVTFIGEQALQTEASSTGSFSSEVLPGAWWVQAQLGSAVGRSRSVLVRAAETSAVGVIVLQTAVQVSGVVTAGGAGVEGAVITVTPHNGAGEIDRAIADVSGRYRLALASGVYDLEATAENQSSELLSGLRVGPADTTADFELPANGTLRGTVVDETGGSTSGLLVVVREQYRPTPARSELVGGDGQFTLGDLPPGTWVAIVAESGVAQGGEERLRIGYTEDDGVLHKLVAGEAKRTTPVRVVATNGGRSGKVEGVLPGTPRVTVTLAAEASLSVTLEGAGPAERTSVVLVSMPDFSFRDEIVATGSLLLLDAMPAGRLHLTAKNARRVGQTEVVLKAGEPGQATVKLLEPGVVSGRLVDASGKPTSGWVGLFTAKGEETEEPSPVDDTGRFSLTAAPGTYLSIQRHGGRRDPSGEGERGRNALPG